MKVVQASTARRRWSHLVSHVFQTANRVMIVRNGRPAAALVHPDAVEFLERLANEADIDDARRALEQARGKDQWSWPDVRRFADLES